MNTDESTITITDSEGNLLDPEDLYNEPPFGSVALTHGDWGTAYQLFFSDGLWHRVGAGGGSARTWAWLCRQRNVRLVYEARVRPSPNVVRAEQRRRRVR